MVCYFDSSFVLSAIPEERPAADHSPWSIEAVVRREPALSQCRAMDAIHVATGLTFAPHLDEPLLMCNFDRRFRAAARQAGFAVHPGA